MRIESGTTSDRRNRVLIILILCGAFSTWFAYDGFYAYPAKNVEWAKQYLPSEGKQADFWTNPLATVTNLEAARGRITESSEAVPFETLTEQLGEPTFRDARFAYYVGPAAFASFEIDENRVVRVDRLEVQREPSESDIRNQKVLALVLAVIGLVVLVHFVRIVRARIVLDEAGLTIGGRTIGWDAMESLDTGKLKEKGWVTLSYRQNTGQEIIRLDSYALDRFDDILATICTRKGFKVKGADPDSEAASG